MKNKNGFEIQTCSRCGGSGEYSYCTMYGSRCFKCSGKKVVFTKRGLAAYYFYLDLFKIPASEVKVGNLIESFGKKARVLEVEVVKLEGSSNGVPYCEEGINLKTAIGHHISGKDHLIMVGATAEVIAERLAKAMEYQASLTKMGKPRKAKVTK